jgi:hypothetical protein
MERVIVRRERPLGVALGVRSGLRVPGRATAFLVGGAVLLILVPLIVVAPGTSLRLALATLLLVDLLAISLIRPTLGALLTLTVLIVLGLLRRVLDAVVGSTTSYDPLLIVGPAVALLLAVRLFAVERRPIVTDRLSGAIALLFALTLLEVLNPESGVLAGALGLLFMAAPLIWFFLGRELATARTLKTTMAMVLVAACASAAYGLFQTYVGLPPWDGTWLASVEASGQYAALNVGGVIRAWGPFASAAEYATMLGAGLAVAVSRVLHRRLFAVPAVPLLGFALFVESSRGVFILAVLAILVIVSLRARSGRVSVAVLVLSLIVAVAAQQVLAANVSLAALSTTSPLISHQLGGLLLPFDPTQSTAGIHLSEIAQAFVGSLSRPLGLGTGATSLAAGHAGIASANSEFDISNAFTSLGLLGGILYFVVVAVAFWRAGSCYRRRRTAIYAATLGLLIICFGQWLNGGYYAISAVVWFIVGAVDREWLVIAAKDRLSEGPDRTAPFPLDACRLHNVPGMSR